MGFWDDLGNDITAPVGWLTGTGSSDPGNADRDSLRGNAATAGGFAGQNASGYNALSGDIAQNRNAQSANIGQLQSLANGQSSVSAEQLRQSLQQNLAAQQAQAAAASPQNAAMAARQAAMNSSRLGYGLAGQQAVAGLQERAQAQQALAQALGQQQQGILGQRGQDLQGALGGYGLVNQGYGTALQNPQKPVGPALLGLIGAGSSMYSSMGGGAAGAGAGGAGAGAGAAGAGGAGAGFGAGAVSDRRLKTDIKDGSDDASDALSKLRAFKFKYRDEQHGKGEQLGVMAQDLEHAGLGHAVMNTPGGKVVHGAKLATALAAMLPTMHARLSKLEGKGEE